MSGSIKVFPASTAPIHQDYGSTVSSASLSAPTLSTSASTATLVSVAQPAKKAQQQQKSRISPTLILMSVAVGMAGNFQFGYLASVLTQPYVAIEQYFNTSWIARTGNEMSRETTAVVMSALNVANPIAAIFGQMLALWICNKYGRKRGALIGCWVMFPGLILSLIAKWCEPVFELLFVGRLIWSISVGGLVVDQTIWLVEVAPIRFRGSVSSMQEVFAALGGLATQAFGVPFSGDDNWPLMFVFPLVLNVFCVAVFCFVPESPSFLYFERHDPDGARRSIAAYHGLTDKAAIEEQFQICSKSGTSSAEVDPTKPKVNGMDIMFRPWKTQDPVSRVIRRGAWVGIMVKLAYLFTGARCIRSFNTYVLHDMGGWDYLAARWGSLIIGLIRMPATFVPVLIADRLGRRPLLLGSTAMSVGFLCLIMFSIMQGAEWKIGTLAGVGGLLTVTSVGVGSLARFYAAELVPRKLLLKSVTVLAILEALMRILLEFTFYPMAHSIGAYYFPVLIIPTVGFLVFMYFYCPETKNREVNDILNEMAKAKGVKVDFHVTNSTSALALQTKSADSSRRGSNESNSSNSSTDSVKTDKDVENGEVIKF